MKTILMKDLKKMLKKEGFRMSDYLSSSRVKGWGSSTRGVNFSGLYPFKTYTTVRGRKEKWTSDEESHSCNVSINFGSRGTDMEVMKEREIEHETESKRLKQFLTKLGLDFNENKNMSGLRINITNPHFKINE